MSERPERFGFTVQHVPAQTWRDKPEDNNDEGWSVNLPHQCGDWEIAGDEWGPPPPHEQAVADLERFIAEAQEALTALRAAAEFGPLAESDGS